MRHWLRLARSVDRLNDWIYAAIRWLVLAMIVLGAYNALARYANRWTDVQLAPNALFDLQWYMFSLVFLLGAAYGLNHDVHVRVDVFYARLRPRVRAWIDLLGTALFVIPFSVVVLVVSWPAVRNSWAIREASSDPGGLVRYPIKTVILLCFVLLLLQGIAVVIEKIALLRAGEAGVEGMTPTDMESARRDRMEGV
jgi:TRAP-type mannitol/chloroaromatic compound transport system permease small subunit